METKSNKSSEKLITEGHRNKEKVIGALREMPIVQVACKRGGVSRATYYRWRKEDKDFRLQSEDAMEQGFEFINDMSESQIVTLIREKKMPAITLWLKYHHPRYGSKARSYEPVATDDDLTEEEQRIVLDALTLTSHSVIAKSKHEKNNKRKITKNSRKQKS